MTLFAPGSALASAIICVMAIVASGGEGRANELILHVFSGGKDGKHPHAGLTLDGAGNLYGTTSGFRNRCLCGVGTVFEIAAGGAYAVLSDFTGDRRGGTNPVGSVVLDDSGNLYGTTKAGGRNGYNGTVFKVSPRGRTSTSYFFCRLSTCADGSAPFAGLSRDEGGNLYGTTVRGGASQKGTVFKLGPDGTETVLHSFTGRPDGSFPVAGVILDSLGNLYGTTRDGGDKDFGTVYRISPDGTKTILHGFSGDADGRDPQAELILDNAGNLYGTTNGAAGFRGNVFKLNPDGTIAILATLPANIGPSRLSMDAAENLYGTTRNGGTHDAGTVFKVAPDGTLTTVFEFEAGATTGAQPLGGVLIDRGGSLYGTVAGGYEYGAVYEITP